jgi:hypothetical protein
MRTVVAWVMLLTLRILFWLISQIDMHIDILIKVLNQAFFLLKAIL